MPETVFPSFSDRKALHDAGTEIDGKNKENFIVTKLSTRQRYQYHAYDYAFRWVVLEDKSGNSPIDLKRLWYDDLLVRQAIRFYENAKFSRKRQLGLPVASDVP